MFIRRLAVLLVFAAATGCVAAPDTDIAAPPDVAAPPADAQTTPSGLAFKILEPGTGSIHPRPQDTAVVHYTGWTTAGEMFDSSVVQGAPLDQFRLEELIPGWIEGVQLMVVGEKRRFWIPGRLAYGECPSRGGSPCGMLVFDVELLDIR